MRGLFNDCIADQVLGYITCFARNLHLYIRQQKSGVWEPVGGEKRAPGFNTAPACKRRSTSRIGN